jgi:glutamate dehydrogenase
MIAPATLEQTLPKALSATERDFAQRFFAQVDANDLKALAPADLEAITREQVKLTTRKQGEVKISFVTNNRKGVTWGARRTMIHLVSDDYAFLVDSVAAYLGEKRLAIDLLLHPRLSISYAASGEARLDPRGTHRQSHIYIVVRGALNTAQQKELRQGVTSIISDVRDATGDWQAMRLRALEAKQFLTKAPTTHFPREEVEEYGEFLDYLYDNNFTFLGARSYRFNWQGNKVTSTVIKGSGLGLLRDDRFPAYINPDGAPLPPPYQRLRTSMPPLSISKVNRISTVHRRVPLDAVTVHQFDDDGRVVGETLFIGLFTSVTYSRSLRSIPLLKYRAERVIRASGFEPASHDGRALRHILEKYPRDELFQTTIADLQRTCLSILRLQERQRIALYCRPDLFDRYVSCLVYVPRDRFETRLRLNFQHILERELDGQCTNYSSSVDDSPLVRILFTIAVKQGQTRRTHFDKIEAMLQDAGRVWGDALADTLHHVIADDDHAERLISAYADAFSSDYRDRYSLAQAVSDIDKIETCLARSALEMDWSVQDNGAITLKLFTPREALVLSDVLPVLENMGLRVTTEHPFTVTPKGTSMAVVVQDFSLTYPAALDGTAIKPIFEEALHGIFAGRYENDALNALCLGASLNARDISLVRTYARYLRQSSLPFSLPYLEQAIIQYPILAGLAAQLFYTRFDPKSKSRATPKIDNAIKAGLDQIASLDHDRIWRALFASINATLRTNFFMHGTGEPKPYISVKLDSRALSFLPDPKPYREIFVYSTRMEGIHLRNGRIARGGIRWSDRAEDFRTEILGLMKAQTVKNAVIVPSGAKGGFIVKNPPKGGDRKAIQAEGIECYRYLVRGLLDITDNYGRGNKVIKPKGVVCQDGDDPYLVVAADKGTATFSDIANGLSMEYGFWMGDAFASGGSAGYDHKAMGITARGAWESVKRHFRERGLDTQKQNFTVMGVGDMGGDVFGNGMLLSPHIQLVGAFNHVHIFCDPNPDTKISFGERQRLFKGVMGWDQYQTKLLSKGGRIYNRSDKVLDLTPDIQKRFDLHKSKVTPPELMTAMLKADVDCLYLGGIGTFVKSSAESHSDAGDRSNDAQRINAADLRAHVVGEGANLGFTQRARIEAALSGVHLNADFIDNSAGVDTSDHEVNIKILLATIQARSATALPKAERNKVLKTMTNEVARLVLTDNYQQTQAISLLQSRAAEHLPHHQLFMQDLERVGVLNRALEFLPNDEEIAKRQVAGLGLTRPELGILLSYAKLRLREELLGSALLDEPECLPWLMGYFPDVLQKRFAKDIATHPLRREITATLIANAIINRLGPTAATSMARHYSAGGADVARAFVMVHGLLPLADWWRTIEAHDGHVASTEQMTAFHEIAMLDERMMGWILATPQLRTQGISAFIKQWGEPTQKLVASLCHAKTIKASLTPAQQKSWGDRYTRWQRAGFEADMAGLLAARSKLGQTPAIISLAAELKRPVAAVASTYFKLTDRFAFSWLVAQAGALPRPDRWASEAMRTVEARLDAVQLALVRAVLRGTKAPDSALNDWLKRYAGPVTEMADMVADMKRTGLKDLAMALVIIQKIERLLLP